MLKYCKFEKKMSYKTGKIDEKQTIKSLITVLVPNFCLIIVFKTLELTVNFRYISKLQNGENRAWIDLDQIFGIKWDRAGWEELSQMITS